MLIGGGGVSLQLSKHKVTSFLDSPSGVKADVLPFKKFDPLKVEPLPAVGTSVDHGWPLFGLESFGSGMAHVASAPAVEFRQDCVIRVANQKDGLVKVATVVLVGFDDPPRCRLTRLRRETH